MTSGQGSGNSQASACVLLSPTRSEIANVVAAQAHPTVDVHVPGDPDLNHILSGWLTIELIALPLESWRTPDLTRSVMSDKGVEATLVEFYNTVYVRLNLA